MTEHFSGLQAIQKLFVNNDTYLGRQSSIVSFQGGGKELEKEKKVRVIRVEVIFQADNVLQPSVMLQAYNLLQVCNLYFRANCNFSYGMCRR